MILERNQFETPLTNPVQNIFFQQETIWVGHQRQAGHLGSEFLQNLVTPISHWHFLHPNGSEEEVSFPG